jgi:hypothetical protein
MLFAGAKKHVHAQLLTKGVKDLDGVLALDLALYHIGGCGVWDSESVRVRHGRWAHSRISILQRDQRGRC